MTIRPIFSGGLSCPTVLYLTFFSKIFGSMSKKCFKITHAKKKSSWQICMQIFRFLFVINPKLTHYRWVGSKKRQRMPWRDSWGENEQRGYTDFYFFPLFLFLFLLFGHICPPATVPRGLRSTHTSRVSSLLPPGRSWLTWGLIQERGTVERSLRHGSRSVPHSPSPHACSPVQRDRIYTYICIYYYTYIYIHIYTSSRALERCHPSHYFGINVGTRGEMIFSLYGDLRFAVTSAPAAEWRETARRAFSFPASLPRICTESCRSLFIDWHTPSDCSTRTKRIERDAEMPIASFYFWHIYKELASSLFFTSTSKLFPSNSRDFCRRFTVAFLI